MLSETLVIIPTFNESGNIARIIDDLMATGSSLDVLVIDDGSPDGTADKVKEAQQNHPGRVHLIEREGK